MDPAPPFFADVADAPPGVRLHWLLTSDGQRLRLAVWPGARGSVVIFPGRTEYIEKYGRTVGRLADLGLAAAVLDWRGQGLSQRSTRHSGLGHVDEFADYQRDVAAVMASPAVAALPQPRYLLGHSMGGCIGLRTLVEAGGFRGAVFSAPMWGLQMSTAAREIATRVAQIAGRLGLGHRPTPGTGGTPAAGAAAFAANRLTTDPERFAWCAAQIAAHPELALGGPSLQWTRAAFLEMTRLGRTALPDLPVLVLLGSDEQVVSPRTVHALTAKLPQGALVPLEGARHEILMERDAIQAQVWARIAGFVAATR